MTANTMAKNKKTQRQTMIYKKNYTEILILRNTKLTKNQE